MKIIKRDGSLVKFNKNKIENAIIKAMKDANEINELMARHISERIENELHDEFVNIEDIQDLIEIYLMKNGLNNTAKHYILYRENRKRIRDLKARLYEDSQQQIKEIMEMKNIENSNANVDEGSFSGKNAKVQGYFLKEWALNNLMDKEVADAHRNGLLYTHDLDSYASGQHNCLFIDFYDLKCF